MPRERKEKLTPEQQQLAASCVGLACMLALRFATFNNLDREEAQSWALKSLCGAARKYDPAKGKFSTYCGHWVKAALLTYRKRHARDRRRLPVKRFTVVDEEALFDAEPEPEQNAYAQEIITIAERFLAPRLWRALRWRYLDGWTLSEIGSVLHVTKERARQLIEEALGKLRKRFDVSPVPSPVQETVI